MRTTILAALLALTFGCDRKGSTAPDDGGGEESSRRGRNGGDELPPQTREHLDKCMAMSIDTEGGSSTASDGMFACQALAPLTPELEAYLQDKCDRGDAAACHVLGDALRGERVVKHVAELVRTACGQKEQCDVLRRQYAVSPFGTGREGGKEKGLALVTRACELGRGEACITRATLTKEVSAAADWMQRACDVDFSPGCAQEIHEQIMFGGSKINGDSVKRLRTLCEQGKPSACASSGVLVARGVQGAAAGDDATDLYQRACASGSAGGCASLVYHAMRNKVDEAQREAAAQALAKECQDGDVGPECAAAAFALHKGWGGAANKSAAKAWLKKNCEAGVEAACHPPRK